MGEGYMQRTADEYLTKVGDAGPAVLPCGTQEIFPKFVTEPKFGIEPYHLGEELRHGASFHEPLDELERFLSL